MQNEWRIRQVMEILRKVSIKLTEEGDNREEVKKFLSAFGFLNWVLEEDMATATDILVERLEATLGLFGE